MNNNTCFNFNNLIIFDAASFLYITNTSNVIIPNLRFFSVVNDVITESNQSLIYPAYTSGGGQKISFCNNTLRSAEYIINVKNNTIIGIDIKYYFQNLSLFDNDITYVSSNFKVTFINNFLNSSMKSGNPGYIKGLPILSGWAGSFQTFDNTTGLNITNKYINQYMVYIIFNSRGLEYSMA